MENKITKEKLNRYLELTTRALKKIKTKIINKKEQEANEIITMAENYLNDAKYFKETKDFVNSFAAINYAHGWIDSGVRLNIFDVKDNKLFTVK